MGESSTSVSNGVLRDKVPVDREEYEALHEMYRAYVDCQNDKCFHGPCDDCPHGLTMNRARQILDGLEGKT